MKIIRTKDYADMSRKAANIISAQVIMKPDCVLGLATGGTHPHLVQVYHICRRKATKRHNFSGFPFLLEKVP